MARPSPFVRHAAAFTDAMGVENAPFILFMARIPWPSDQERDDFIKGLTGKEPRVYQARVRYAADPTPTPSAGEAPTPPMDIGGGDLPIQYHLPTRRPVPMPQARPMPPARPYYDVDNVKPGRGKKKPHRVTEIST